MAPLSRKGRDGPPIRGMIICAIDGPFSRPNQISALSPEKPSFRKVEKVGWSGGISGVTLRKIPVPTWLSQMSN